MIYDDLWSEVVLSGYLCLFLGTLSYVYPWAIFFCCVTRHAIISSCLYLQSGDLSFGLSGSGRFDSPESNKLWTSRVGRKFKYGISKSYQRKLCNVWQFSVMYWANKRWLISWMRNFSRAKKGEFDACFLKYYHQRLVQRCWEFTRPDINLLC